jgi:hypothetical protein
VHPPSSSHSGTLRSTSCPLTTQHGRQLSGDQLAQGQEMAMSRSLLLLKMHHQLIHFLLQELDQILRK